MGRMILCRLQRHAWGSATQLLCFMSATGRHSRHRNPDRLPLSSRPPARRQSRGSIARLSCTQAEDEEWSPAPGSKEEKAYVRAKARACWYLARRPYTRRDLLKKMVEKGFDESISEKAIERLAETGLQSDLDFATSFARSKWRTAAWSPCKIRGELRRQHQLPESLIEEAMMEAFDDGGEGREQELGVGAYTGVVGSWDVKGCSLEEESEVIRRLVDVCGQRLESMHGLPVETQKRRLAGFLARRGFSWPETARVFQWLKLMR